MTKKRLAIPLLTLAFAVSCAGKTSSGGGDNGGGSGPGGGAGTDPGGGGSGNDIGSAGSTGSGGAIIINAECVKPDPGPSPIRRLNSWEYNNTVRDLLGDNTQPASVFPIENRVGAFDNNAVVQNVSALLAENYLDVAERLVANSWANVSKTLPCAVTAGDAACAAKFIDTWGRKAWRRPLVDQEKTALNALFTSTQSAGFAVALQRVMQAMLQSPQFLYRVEVPQKGTAKVPLNQWELASRLSYMLWGSMPDDALFTAAQNGKLGTKEEVAAQARRMMMEPAGRQRARQMASMFHREWLGMERIGTLDKSISLYPNFATNIRPFLQSEIEGFLDAVIWDSGGTVDKLFTAPFTMVNKTLFGFYRMSGTAPAGDTAYVRVDLDPAIHAGLLTQGALNATNAKPDQTYPPGRGKFVRENLFCQPLPPPVAGVMPPMVDPSLTGRQRWETHANQACARACHLLMDPIGLGLEDYDFVGRYRATENGSPVDASGEITGTDVDGTFVGGVGLSKKVAASDEVSVCLMTQWFWFAYGRANTVDDACNMQDLHDMFKAGGYSIPELLVSLTQTDAFMFRRPGGTP